MERIGRIGKFLNAFSSGMLFACVIARFATQSYVIGIIILLLSILNGVLYFIEIDS